MGSGSSKKSKPVQQQPASKPQQQQPQQQQQQQPQQQQQQELQQQPQKQQQQQQPQQQQQQQQQPQQQQGTKSDSAESALKTVKGQNSGNSGKTMSWLEVLDKVANVELWEGTNRSTREPWKQYLTKADDIVRRPRKPIPKDVVRAILEGDMSTVDVGSVPNAQPKVVVFVSSTFTDTKAERNQLMRDVYPYLRELCRRLSIEFGTVDMRWGVTEEATNDHSTVEMCINEVKRCVKESIGPAFLCFVGNKYGYRPLPASIVNSEYDEMRTYLKKNGHDLTLMDQYYQTDTNAVPPSYVLRQKSAEMKSWWDDVEFIQGQMREAIVACYGSGDSRCDKYHVSVTETEIQEGAFKNGNQADQVRFIRRTLDNLLSDTHMHRKLTDMKNPTTVDEYAKEKMKELKEQKIQANSPSSVIHDVAYADSEIAACGTYIKGVCDHVCEELTTAIFKGYENKLHVEEDKEFQESVHHRTHANEKASLFVGREAEIGRIIKYIQGSDNRPLAVHGVSGCGKTALMAVAAKKAKEARRDSALILRFLGTTGQSGSARGVLLNLCMQITRIYGQDPSKIPTSYKDLINYFQTCLSFANNGKPLILFLDSLDQLSNEDFGQNLAWLSLSDELPENVKIVVSSLPTRCLDILKNHLAESNLVEVKSLNPDHGQDIMNKMLKLHNRTVTKSQEKVILDAFKKCPLPLFLRLVVDIAVKWRSYDDVSSDDIADDMQGLINKLFLQLETKFGELFVQHALAYITAAKQGLSLAELEDILSCDDEVLTSIFKWWVPPIRRMPPLLWARVRNELGMYLAERGTAGISAYGWYHRQFWETAEQRYLHTPIGDSTFYKKAHEAIADYFDGKWVDGKPYVPKGETKTQIANRKLPSQSIVVSGDRKTRRQLNRRKLSELPFHLIRLKEWTRFQTLVMDLPYIEAKFEAQDGYNCLSELIEATKLSGNEDIKQLTRFVGSNLGFLIRESAAVYQMAFQLSKESAVRVLLSQVEPSYLPLPLMKNLDDTDYPDPCEMTMYGHTETLRCCDYSPKGDLILSSADDTTMRVWDAVTGAEIVTVTSLPKPIFPPKDAPMQLMLHPVNPCCFSATGDTIGSGTELGSVMLWDIGGVQLQSHTTSNGSVNHICFSNNNKYIATAHKNSIVSIWSASDLGHVADINIQWEELSWVDFSPDDSQLAVLCFRGLSLVNTANWSVRTKNQGNAYLNLCVAFHPHGKQLMSGGDNSCVTIWDAASGTAVASLRKHTAWIWCIKFSGDGRKMFTCSSDRTMRIWDRNSDTSWTSEVSVGGHSHRVSMVAIDRSSEAKLVTSSLDRSLKVWDAESLYQNKTPPVGTGHYNVLVTSSKGTYFATSQGWHRDCNVFRSHDASSPIGSSGLHTGFIRKARFSEDETKLVVIDHGHTGTYDSGAEKNAVVRVVSIPDLTELARLSVSSPLTLGVNRNSICVGTIDGQLVLFDLERFGQVNSWTFGTGQRVYNVAGCPSTNRWAASSEKACMVWDASSDHCTFIGEITDFTENISLIEFNPSGSILSVGLNSGLIHILDVTDNGIKLNKILTDHESYVKDIAFSPSGEYMVTSAGLSMRVWDVTKGMTLKCVYYSPVNCADFLSENVVFAGEATGLLKSLTF